MLELIPRRAVWIASRALLTGVVLCAVAASARAGEYHVYSCRTPAGEPAPADGWSGSKSGVYTYAENTCSQPGGALLAALGDEPSRVANADIATWTFAPPPGASIAGATLWRAGDVDGGTAVNATYRYWLAGPTGSSAFDQCSFLAQCPMGAGNRIEPLSPENRVPVPATNLGGGLYASVDCSGISEYDCPEGAGDPNNYAAAVYLYAADLILEQTLGPSATNVSGELASAPSVQGTSDVAFTATDPGAGVYEAQFSVDGEVVQSTVLDEDGGRCHNVGQTTDGLPAFLYLQPCPASLSADVPFDTALVSNGSHHLVVSVLDAAGNSAPVLDREITVDNPPPPGAPGPPNGAGASSHASLEVRWRSTRHVSLVGGYGRSETVTGRLTGPGGAPIAGAALDLSASPRYEGARPVAMTGPRTSATGAFLLHLPRGLSSCTLRFGYRSHLGETIPAVTRSLDLNVRAGLGLRIAPRTASVGHSIFFSGRLRGRPIPPDGKQLVLEARSPGGPWLEFDVIRSDPRGRYRASYTFKFPGPADYEFRVVSEAEADYPYAWGASKVVAVFER